MGKQNVHSRRNRSRIQPMDRLGGVINAFMMMQMAQCMLVFLLTKLNSSKSTEYGLDWAPLPVLSHVGGRSHLHRGRQEMGRQLASA